MRVKFVSTGTIYGALIGAISDLPVSGAHFGVFAMATSVEPVTVTSKDVLVAGSKTDVGDRSCYHMKLEGELTVLPSSLVSQSVEDVSTRNGYTPATTPQTVCRYVVQGTTYKVIGPVAVNTVPSYYQAFPDIVMGSVVQEGAYLEIKSTGSSFERILHYKTVDKKTGWSGITHYSDSFVVDFPGRRYQDVRTGYWYPLIAVASASIPVDDSFLPKSKREYDHLLHTLKFRYQKHEDALILGDLVRRCANDAQVVQTNSIELVRDLRELTDSLKEAYALTKGKFSAKKIAQGYLSYKYGARLTAQDLQLIAKTVEDQLKRQHLAYSKVHASNVVTFPAIEGTHVGPLVVKYTYTIRYRPYSQDWRRGVQLTWDSGLFPSLQNLWDLVPLSFVVDWFSQMGDRLSAIDAETYWSTYDILGCCSSQKMVFSDVTSLFLIKTASLIGKCDLHFYDRSPTPGALPPAYFVNSPREFKNYAEALALVVANKRR